MGNSQVYAFKCRVGTPIAKEVSQGIWSFAKAINEQAYLETDTGWHYHLGCDCRQMLIRIDPNKTLRIDITGGGTSAEESNWALVFDGFVTLPMLPVFEKLVPVGYGHTVKGADGVDKHVYGGGFWLLKSNDKPVPWINKTMEEFYLEGLANGSVLVNPYAKPLPKAEKKKDTRPWYKRIFRARDS